MIGYMMLRVGNKGNEEVLECANSRELVDYFRIMTTAEAEGAVVYTGGVQNDSLKRVIIKKVARESMLEEA